MATYNKQLQSIANEFFTKREDGAVRTWPSDGGTELVVAPELT